MSGSAPQPSAPADVLLVEDSPSDIRLAQEGLRRATARCRVHVVRDGRQALAFLRRTEPFTAAPRPSLILLDLNLPRMDGRELLAEIKNDASLRTIPVCVLTTSTDPRDILQSYDLHANCYITKTMDVGDFLHKLDKTCEFWLAVVSLPPLV
jgi:CheY-like chemotaxis protein